jgi:hypothetical protein
MGRPPKNPSNPLTRLRGAISTAETPVTREILAKRCGVPAPTIRDIETGRIMLTESVARKIMLTTGVATQSLLKAENPLKDIAGRELSPQSGADMVSEVFYKQRFAMLDLLDAALKAAEEKNRGIVFYQLFNEWLPQAIALIDATGTMKKVLNRNLGLFDTTYVPEAFQPTDPKMKKRWNESFRDLLMAVIEKAGGKEKAFSDPDAYHRAYDEILYARRQAKISNQRQAE